MEFDSIIYYFYKNGQVVITRQILPEANMPLLNSGHCVLRGLLCHLLHIKSQTSLKKHRHYGFLFENWIISEIKKNRFNAGQQEGLYYFRDNVGNEVDLITEKNGEPFAIEIKASSNVKPAMLHGLNFWQKYQPISHSVLLHTGKKNEVVNDRLGIVP